MKYKGPLKVRNDYHICNENETYTHKTLAGRYLDFYNLQIYLLHVSDS